MTFLSIEFTNCQNECIHLFTCSDPQPELKNKLYFTPIRCVRTTSVLILHTFLSPWWNNARCGKFSPMRPQVPTWMHSIFEHVVFIQLRSRKRIIFVCVASMSHYGPYSPYITFRLWWNNARQGKFSPTRSHIPTWTHSIFENRVVIHLRSIKPIIFIYVTSMNHHGPYSPYISFDCDGITPIVANSHQLEHKRQQECIQYLVMEYSFVLTQ